MNETLVHAAALIVPMVLAIVFHEVAHGWTARSLGDPTAAELNRLSLNPLRHIDPFGTVILPGFLGLIGAPVFGWAKPVPVNPNRLRNPRWGMVLVAAAGPATNIALVALTVGLLVLAGKTISPEHLGELPDFVGQNIVNFISINLFLAVFNMIPVPPFDGSKVFAGFLPDALRWRFQSLDRFALPIMLALLVLLPRLGPQYDVIGRIVVPIVSWLYNSTGSMFMAMMR